MTRPDWTAAIAEAERIVAAWASPGAAAPGGTVLLFDRDRIRGAASAGLASLQHGIPFTPATPSRFASITKHLLCAFALLRGIDLAAPLGGLLPGLPAPLSAVSALRALSMTGGIPDLLQSYLLCGVPASAGVDAAALDAFTAALPGLDFAPGTEMSYSNTGYRLVEQALARQGGLFGAWVEGPLNAALGTGFRFPAGWDRPIPGLADGYWREGPEAPWRIGAYGMALSASGALAGSAEDLAAWLRALLRGETTTAHSEAFSLDAMRITTIDTTLPPIPIDVMAIRPRMTMLAARLGDGLSLSVGASHEYIRSQIALVQRVLDENGRDREAFRVSASVICSIDTDIAAARAGLAQSAVSFPLSTMPELHTGLELPSPQALAEAKALGGVERAAALFRPETVDGLGLVATPETLNVALDRYREDGLDEIIVLLAGPPNKHPALIRALAAASEASTAGHPPISVARVPRVGARG